MKGWNKICVVFAAFFSVFLCKTLMAGQEVTEKLPKTAAIQKSATVGWVEARNPTNHPEQGDTGKPTKGEVIQKIQTLHVPFIANNGQVDERVMFYAKTFGGTVFVTKEGEIVYSLPEGASGKGAEEQGGRGGKVVLGWHGQALLVRAESEFVAANAYSPLLHADIASCLPERIIAKSLIVSYLPGLQEGTDKQSLSMPPNSQSAIQNPQSPTRGVVLKEQLIGGKINEIKGIAQSVTTVSYFKGNDPSKWKTNISTYDVVSLGEVYNGIELKLKAYGNNAEKLFCVKPGADSSQIKVSLSGVKNPKSEIRNPKLSVNEHGELEVETALGTVKFTKPIAYQEIDGKRVEVDVEYRLSNPKSTIPNPNSEYSFIVASYDKTKDLIIDPLLASTYLGGYGTSGEGEAGMSITLDTSGNVYVTGSTNSTNFPTTSGAYDTSYNDSGNYYDVFVSKFNSGLTSLLASTFLGGSNADYGYSLTLDTSGNVYVTGETRSTNFPTTSGVYDTLHNGSDDVFVSKLNNGLTSLLASTFLGGSSGDVGRSLTLDTSGDVYVTGKTSSANFPTISGALDTTHNGGDDVFVSKLNNGLTGLLASTFLGGSDTEYVNSLTLDASGNVYVMGYTNSTGFPIVGAYDNTFNGVSDVFVSKLNSVLGSLLASTFLGGSSKDEGGSLTLDTSGNVYVMGVTSSTDFPTTSGAYDTSFSGGWDVFISKLDSVLGSLPASTFLGGSDNEAGRSLTLDTSGNVYVTGRSNSTDFPTTSGAYDTSFNGGGVQYIGDVFVSKLSSGLGSLLASTFLGGSSGDEGYSLTLDTSGNVYVTGRTNSTNFPTTSGAYDTSYNGGGTYDVFVSKLDGNLSATVECKAESITALPNKLTLRKGKNGDVTITVKGAGDCLVEGVMVTATINGKGKRLIGVSPDSQETDANGQAVFTIKAKDKKGTAVIKFKASGLDELVTVQVKVR